MAEGPSYGDPASSQGGCGGQDDRICTRRGETAPRKALFSAQALELEVASMLHNASCLDAQATRQRRAHASYSHRCSRIAPVRWYAYLR